MCKSRCIKGETQYNGIKGCTILNGKSQQKKNSSY